MRCGQQALAQNVLEGLGHFAQKSLGVLRGVVNRNIVAEPVAEMLSDPLRQLLALIFHGVTLQLNGKGKMVDVCEPGRNKKKEKNKRIHVHRRQNT